MDRQGCSRRNAFKFILHQIFVPNFFSFAWASFRRHSLRLQKRSPSVASSSSSLSWCSSSWHQLSVCQNPPSAVYSQKIIVLVDSATYCGHCGKTRVDIVTSIGSISFNRQLMILEKEGRKLSEKSPLQTYGMQSWSPRGGMTVNMHIYVS